VSDTNGWHSLFQISKLPCHTDHRVKPARQNQVDMFRSYWFFLRKKDILRACWEGKDSDHQDLQIWGHLNCPASSGLIRSCFTYPSGDLTLGIKGLGTPSFFSALGKVTHEVWK
jgi:hypothetical protein